MTPANKTYQLEFAIPRVVLARRAVPALASATPATRIPVAHQRTGARRASPATSELYRWDVPSTALAIDRLDVARDALVVTLAVVTRNECNGPHGNPYAAAAKHKRVRTTVTNILAACPEWTTLPVTVTITRHSAGKLDAHDGLGSALKPAIDAIADWLPLPKKRRVVVVKGVREERWHADDSDPRVTWVLEQGKCSPGQTWLTVRLEARLG